MWPNPCFRPRTVVPRLTPRAPRATWPLVRKSSEPWLWCTSTVLAVPTATGTNSRATLDDNKQKDAKVKRKTNGVDKLWWEKCSVHCVLETRKYSAYQCLRQKIPNVPVDTKLSKIKTLRYATNYIKYLGALLNDEISNETDFNPTNSI